MKPLPTIEYLNECFIYNHDTGQLIWRERPEGHFNKAHGWRVFNTQFAGTIAGSVNHNGYRHIGVLGVIYIAHRLIYSMFNDVDSMQAQIDHIDGNGLNNRLNNLRLVTPLENMQNQKRRKTNTSGVTGVTWLKPSQKWRAQIRADGKQKQLGLFDNLFDAACARKSADITEGYHTNHGRD